MKSISVGQIAYSKAGRDQGRAFIIVNVVDDEYVEVADGTLRKLAKPKRKKLKHLDVKKDFCESIKTKLELGKQVFDAEIRNSLEQFKTPGDN